MRVGKCSECGRDAAYNTPYINYNGELFCDICAFESTDMMRGVEQHLTEGGNYKEDSMGHFAKNHCILSISHGCAAWTEDGLRAFKLTDKEKEMASEDPEGILDLMAELRASGKFRCSSCGVEMREDEVGAFPLFAGVICRDCAVEYNERIKQEREEGKVCLSCRQPLSLCCC